MQDYIESRKEDVICNQGQSSTMQAKYLTSVVQQEKQDIEEYTC